MKKGFKNILKILIVVGSVYMIIFQQNWIRINVVNRFESMFLVYKGDRAFRKNKFAYSIEYYNRGLALFPKHYTAWYNLGNMYVVYEDYNSAVEAYKEAIKHNPKYVVARMNLGIILAEKLGNFDEAIEQYEKILTTRYHIWAVPIIFNNKRSSRINRGLAYYNMGRAYRQKALYLTDAERNLTMPLLLKSAEAYEKACKILKKNSDARYNLALDYHLLGNYRDAGKNYCKAIELAPMNYEAHYNLALLLRRMKRYGDSLDELEKAALLVSNAGNESNAIYILGILSDVSRSYMDYNKDLVYVEMTKDNQEVSYANKKQKNNKDKNLNEEVFISPDGRIRPSDKLDKRMMIDMSHCAGYSYFRNKNNEY